MNVIDLFSGVGGFSLGFKQEGFNVSLAVDNWRVAIDSHKANHPETDHLLSDIRKVKAKHLERYNAHVVLGSPPCQQFSVANNNPDVAKGLELTNLFLDLIDELNPKYWIMENVPGVIKNVRSRIIKLGGRTHILNAADYGTPQIRKRAFCGYFPFPYPTHNKTESNSLHGPLKKWVTVKEALMDIQLPEDENLIPTPKSLERARAVLRKDKIPYRTEIVKGDKLSHTITCHVGRDFSTGGLIDTSFYDRHGKNFYSFNRPSNTVTSKTLNMHIMTDNIRRLSSAESKVLMGFPKDYILCSSAITTRFKLLGNAVCPQVSRALAKSIRRGF